MKAQLMIILIKLNKNFNLIYSKAMDKIVWQKRHLTQYRIQVKITSSKLLKKTMKIFLTKQSLSLINLLKEILCIMRKNRLIFKKSQLRMKDKMEILYFQNHRSSSSLVQ